MSFRQDNQQINKEKKFIYGGSKYNLSNYFGRLQSIFGLCNNATLFHTNAQILKYKQILIDHSNGKNTGYTDKELWKMQTVCNSAIHPQTGKIISRPWRMSSFSLTNLPISAGFALAPPTLGWVVFWQTVNQTYNALFNYSNRNSSSDGGGLSQILTSYGCAVTASVSIALLLGKFAQSIKKPGLRIIGTKIVPFIAVAAAGATNVLLVRSSDIQKGIEVKDERGYSYGISKYAGKQVLQNVMLSRVILPIPGVLLPPVLLHYVDKMKISRNPKIKFAINLFMCYCLLTIALPMAIATFPDQIKIDVRKLEPQYQNLTDSQGRKISYLFGNKGV